MDKNIIKAFLDQEDEMNFTALFNLIIKNGVSEEDFEIIYLNTKSKLYKACFCTLKHRFLEALCLFEEIFNKVFEYKDIKINDNIILCYIQTIYNSGAIDKMKYSFSEFTYNTNKLRYELYLNAITLNKEKCIHKINNLLDISAKDYDITICASIIKNLQIDLNKIYCKQTIINKIKILISGES